MAMLGWEHKTLIQALLNRGPINESDFCSMLAPLIGKAPRQHPRELNNFLLKINKELSQFQIELRCFRDQNNGDVCYGIVNNSSDDQSKLGTKYSAPQIALFKGIVEAIIDNDASQGTISNFQALNTKLENVGINASQEQGNSVESAPALRNFTMGQKEKAIEELVEDRWLCRGSDARIGLGTRSYLDLRSWFLNSGVPSCQLCNEVALKGRRCQSEGCSNRVHEYCLKNKDGQSARNVCGGCGLQWPCLNSDALEDEEESSQITAKRSRKNREVEPVDVVVAGPNSRRTRSHAQLG